MPPIKCDVCRREFADSRYLQEHRRRVHNAKKYSCCHCGFSAAYKCILKNHIERLHLREDKNKNRTIVCCLCAEFQCSKRQSMIEHYVNVHDVNMERQFFTFQTADEFENWKSQKEKDESARFIRASGIRKSGGNKVLRLRCFRSGVFTSHGKGKRSLKRIGSNKIGGICPAYMKIIQNIETGIVRVEYLAQHVGHSAEIGRLNLSKKEKEEIAQKLSAKVPFGVILDDIRDSVHDNQMCRLHVTTRKDLWNLMRDYNLQGDSMLHSDDSTSTSVQAWVNKAERESNLVRLHKPQHHVAPDHPELKEEDFILIIANDAQLEILKQYGPECICFDGTRGMNRYDFELTALLVLDEMNQGFPCAFLLSNRCDSEIISLFVATLKKSLQSPIQTKLFMSDLAETYFNGWCDQMPMPSHRLFCAWHVDRAWCENLNKIRDLEKRARAYKIIRTLMEETDVNAFLIHFDNAIDFFKNDEDYSEFGLYFERNYSTNRESWAFCYRKHCKISTNLHLESMHKVLKHFYLNGKNVKRLDKAIEALMRFTRDKMYDQLVIKFRGKSSSKLEAIRDRHKKSLTMHDCTIISTVNGWQISSQSDHEMYDLSKQMTPCNCNLKCLDCSVCIHAFRCTCVDSVMKWNFCKHIHLLISFLKESLPAASTTSAAENEEQNELSVYLQEDTLAANIITQELSSKNNWTSDSNFERRKQRIMVNFSNILDKAVTDDHLDVLERALAPMGPAFEAINSVHKFSCQ